MPNPVFASLPTTIFTHMSALAVEHNAINMVQGCPDEAGLRAAIGPKTSAIVINTPLNPIGRVFDHEELEALARVVKETSAVVISDEVYEHLAFDGKRIAPLISFPGMHERCVRIGSAG